MADPSLTKEELIALIDAVAREHRDELLLKPTGVWQQHHEDFCRKLARKLTEALRDTQFAWAKIPSPGDHLYKILVSAVSSSGATFRIGLTSEDTTARETARYVIADEIMTHLRATGTAVVRRRRRRSAQ